MISRFTKFWLILKIPQNPPHGKEVLHFFSKFSSTLLSDLCSNIAKRAEKVGDPCPFPFGAGRFPGGMEPSGDGSALPSALLSYHAISGSNLSNKIEKYFVEGPRPKGRDLFCRSVGLLVKRVLLVTGGRRGHGDRLSPVRSARPVGGAPDEQEGAAKPLPRSSA